MQMKTVNWALVSGIVMSALVGCSVAAGQTSQSGEMGASAGAIHKSHDPAQFVQRFDKNADGILELSELPERMQKWLGKADVNGDKKLTVEELKAHAQARRDQMFVRADKDGNGNLSAEELGRKWEHLRVADVDGNGNLTRAELDQARAEGKLHHRGGPGHRGHHGKDEGDAARAKGRGHSFEKLDKNSDGAVTADEVHDRFWARLVKADVNNDGKVTKAELEQARAQRNKR